MSVKGAKMMLLHYTRYFYTWLWLVHAWHNLARRFFSRLCGPTVWNSLPKTLHLTDNYSQFRRHL